MDHDQVYIRPAEIFSSSTGTSFKAQTIPPTSYAWGEDDKFVRYDSSPESMDSSNEDNIFSPLDEASSVQSRALLNAIKQQLFPHQDQAGPLTAFPMPLDSLQESLVSNYLNCQSENLYGFSPELRPHPAATVFLLAIRNPALFHVVLAISATYRLKSGQYQSPAQQRQLECAVMTHKGEAMQLVRNLSSQMLHGKQNEDLMVAIMGFGMLERYCRDSGSGIAPMHFTAGRQLLRSMGGPLHIQNIFLSRSIAHFECGYGSTLESFVWDRSDFGNLHKDLNRFFTNVWTFQAPPPSKKQSSRRSSIASLNANVQHEEDTASALQFGSILYDCLSRRPQDQAYPTQHDQREIVFQVTSLLIISTLMVDYWTNPEGFQAYMDSIHDLVAASQTRDHAANNIMWLLIINDHSDMHSKRVWAVAGWTWVLRHVNYNVQNMVKGWLLSILTGRPVQRALKLDSFAFSYAS